MRGIEQFSHLWIIWGFDDSNAPQTEGSQWSPTVRPPRLGGNQRLGVFATRSPNRPNRIALSSVRLLRIEQTAEGHVLVVQGADMKNGSPVYDIKPYIPYTDSHPDAIGGFTDTTPAHKLNVVWTDKANSDFQEIQKTGANQTSSNLVTTREEINEILAADPRPAYHNDPQRIYGFEYNGCEIKFRVTQEHIVYVTAVIALEHIQQGE